ncbi:AAA family ATPase [Streptomyces sp. NPDC056796]|uniref:helix-turn-helix transcriptional regulator n=1 Tax=Streptomyces sp. NPDC056796 TaxID=3345947 RepID=UPI00367C22E2
MGTHIGSDRTGAHRTGSDDAGLLGREHEKALVTALLAGASRGGRVLRLNGAAGTGRSAVLRHAASAAAHQGIRVLSTGWAPGERGVRHAALHGLLRPELARVPGLPATERAVLESAFGGGPTVPPPAELAAAVLNLLAVEPGPVLLCVDDLDRLDSASRDTLNALARLCPGTRVGVILSERGAPGAQAAPDQLAATLGALPGPEARAVLTRAGRATGYAEEHLVLAVARGNPLALTELSLGDGHLGEEAGFGMLPATPRLAEAYAEDLAGLSVPARGVLLVASLSVSAVAQDILGASALLLGSSDAAGAGLAETIARGLVTDDDVPAAGATARRRLLRFPQPLVRPVVLHLESTARRMAVHAMLGQSVGSPAHAAWHTARVAAGPDEELAGRLESLAGAGPRAGTGVLVALAALEGAARLSADPGRRADRLLRAAELACDHGLVDQALRHARQIDPAGLGTFGRALLLWVHELLPGNTGGGRERITELCEAARAVASREPALARKLLHAAARRCWWQKAGPGERQVIRATFEELRSAPWDARDLAVMALTDPLSVLPRAEPRPVPGLPAGDEPNLLGQVAHLTGDLDRAATHFGKAEAAVRAAGRHGRLPQILVPRAMGQIWLGGQWDTALALAEEGRMIAGRTAQPDWVARATATLGIVEALRGHHGRALEYAAQVEEASLRLGQDRQLHLASLARALTASGTGRYAEAYARLRGLFTEPSGPCAYAEFWGLAFLSEAAPPAGEAEDARTVVAQVASLTAAGRAPLLERILAYADAVLAPDAEAEDRYRRALEPGIEAWPLLHGMARFGHGAWLRRRRRVTASRTPLATAESVFRALGARSRAEQAASELRATGLATAGHQDRDSGDSGADALEALSPQQLTIARLAARGLTNRDIGEQLRLSPRTVASHLYQIFPKLDVTSRAELAARFGDV